MSLARSLRTVLAVVCYFAAYLAASGLDLWTTELALSLTKAAEGNAFVVDNGAYDAGKAWALTWVAGALLTVLFAFGVMRSDRISEFWLRRPLRSFLSLRSNPLFSIPWSKHVIDRSPLHAVSCAVAFVILRLLAAVNNASIAAGEVGPLGTAVGAVGKATSPLMGFILAIGAIYVALVLVVSVVAAKMIADRRAQDEGWQPAATGLPCNAGKL